MSNHNNDIHFSAADIEKYWRGQLSAVEMHAMEKAAQEDPFLADAMDGYENKALKGGQATVHDINDLKDRLAERIAERKLVPIKNFSWWKLAAAIFVLLGGVWLYNNISNSRLQQNIAATDTNQENVPNTNHDTLKELPTPPTIEKLKDVSLSEKKQELADKKMPGGFQSKEKKIDSNSLAAATEQREITSVSSEKAAANVQTGRKEELKKGDEPAATIQKTVADADDMKPLAPKPAINTFNGTVIDQSKQPVTNAIIQIPNLNIATQTDKKGNFSFKAPDTVLSVSVASLGFETQNLKLQNNAGYANQIVLTPATGNLDEVVVTGLGTKNKKSVARAKDLTIHILDAEPTVDWNEYNKYLEKNKKVSNQLKDIHGDVVVSFIVDSKNGLKNFNIAKSLQDQLDEEAIRLIKEGPSWRLLKGKKAKVSVIVKF